MRKQVRLKTVEQLLEDGWKWSDEEIDISSNLVNTSLGVEINCWQIPHLGKWIIVNFHVNGSFEYQGSIFPDGLIVGHSKLEQIVNKMRKEIGLKKTELVDDIPLEEQGFVDLDDLVDLEDITVPFEGLDI